MRRILHSRSGPFSGGRVRIVAWLATIAVVVSGAIYLMARDHRRPSADGSAPGPSAAELDRLASELRRDVERLAGDIGERHVGRPEELGAAVDFITDSFTEAGYRVERLEFEVPPRLHARYTRGHAPPDQPLTCVNLQAEVAGTGVSPEIVVIGAHYDTVAGSPGADDNASGVAAVLALARRLHGVGSPRTIRFVTFANEEPPFFQTDGMGSREYARAARARGEPVVAMLALESLGYYDHRRDSQGHPAGLSLLYPDVGDFVAVVGNLGSGQLVQWVAHGLRSSGVATEAVVAPGWLWGIDWSDHASFWPSGYSAVMVTDTAPYRNPGYHSRTDTADTLDYLQMAKVVAGLQRVVEDLAGRPISRGSEGGDGGAGDGIRTRDQQLGRL